MTVFEFQLVVAHRFGAIRPVGVASDTPKFIPSTVIVAPPLVAELRLRVSVAIGAS